MALPDRIVIESGSQLLIAPRRELLCAAKSHYLESNIERLVFG
jgi:hypothetical protein